MNTIITTNDGSSTLYSNNFEETYHSLHGARAESFYVFVKQGLEFSNKTRLNIFEMGFGTGLNCLLTFMSCKNKKIYYHSIEKYPLTMKEYANFMANLDTKDHLIYEHIVYSNWGKSTLLSPNMKLFKHHEDITTCEIGQDIDVVYYDAFSPRKQPELWKKPILKKMYDCLNTDGVFVTYCAQGQLKRDLKSLGFYVETLPGPPGKREMIRAIK